MIKVVSLTQTCGACPSQWDGETDDGKSVYIRFRHGFGCIEIDGDEIISWTDDDPWNGFISESDMMQKTESKIDWSSLR